MRVFANSQVFFKIARFHGNLFIFSTSAMLLEDRSFSIDSDRYRILLLLSSSIIYYIETELKKQYLRIICSSSGTQSC